MAGIGFEIRKLLTPFNIVGGFGAYFYAGILSCGAWVLSMLGIGILNYLFRESFRVEEGLLFSSTVTHAYAIALIIIGPFQYVLCRHAADLISAGKKASIFPELVAVLATIAMLATCVGFLVFVSFSDQSILYRVGSVGLLTQISMIFVCSNYLGALRDYKQIVTGFLIGSGISVFASWLCEMAWGVDGAIFGYSLGQACLFAFLFAVLYQELGGSTVLASWGFIEYLKRFPLLVMCGFFYNLGIWVDKIMFWWFSTGGIHVEGILFTAPDYDVPVYLSFISIIPGFAMLLLFVETNFFESIQRFFKAINHGTLSEIQTSKREMVKGLRERFNVLAVVQAFTTLLILLFSHEIGEFLGIGSLQTMIFRMTLIGAMLLILFLCMLTILFYLNDIRGAFICALVFCTGNTVLSSFSILQNEGYYGIGFACATGLALVLSGVMVNRRVKRFEYHVFHQTS